MAIFKEGYVNEDGSIIDPKFHSAYFNYAKAIKVLETINLEYYCQEQELDALTKEWVTCDTEKIYI